MSNKLFIFVGLYFSTISAGKMNFKLYKIMLIKAHSLPQPYRTAVKPTTLEIFQECLLCYDQSQQRSGDASLPHNHKLIKLLVD